MLMPKYDRSSITPQDPTRLAEDGSRQVNTLTKSHSVSGVFGCIFSLIVVRTVVCTTFHFLWGKMHTETKIRLPPKLTTRVSSGELLILRAMKHDALAVQKKTGDWPPALRALHH